MITRQQLIKKYLDFFRSKQHKIIPSESLIPKNDPTVLFTTAGMHPLVPYLLGQKHPLGKRIANVQKCIRTTDIDEVGNSFHHTFFEMLGNWSLGDYWKKEAIEYSFEFLTSKKWLGLNKNKLAVSCFRGDSDAPRDGESSKVWLSLGIPKERIAFLPKDNNWWGPAGETGPCGPDTEMFYWNGKTPAPKKFNPKDTRWIEIWNDVFMQYNKTAEGKFVPLKQRNVDTGMGVERTLATLNGLEDNYETEVWKPIIEKIESISGKKYKGNEKAMRIIADHIKAAVFIIADGISPSNTQQGYVLRRLIRRMVYYGKELRIDNISKIAEPVFEIYKGYKELTNNKKNILRILKEEEDKFNRTLKDGIKKVEVMAWKKQTISGKEAFLLYQSHGVPLDVIIDIANKVGSIQIRSRRFLRKNNASPHSHTLVK